MTTASAPTTADREHLARENMIEQQIRPWEVSDPTVLALLRQVPREAFVPPHLRSLAFADFELPLRVDGVDTGETMWAPRVEARILQALAIRPHENVLEIGTGSGYLAALAAHRAQHVWTVEIDPVLREFGAANLARAGVRNAHVEGGDGAGGWAAHAPYDVIIVSGSLPFVPRAMLEQLRASGRLAAIVGTGPVMEARIITRTSGGSFETLPLFETVVRPLRNAQRDSAFRF